MFAFLLIFPILFSIDNKEFIDQVEKERALGAEWHYVGKQALDPTAKSIPLQCMEAVEHGEDIPCGEPYIVYKLKMPKND